MITRASPCRTPGGWRSDCSDDEAV
jgi:hypothetical protein